MKLQHLSVIFVIIILPISIVISVYTNNLVKVANLQSNYDTILMNSTYDAVRAYQLNTLNNSFASVNESRIRDVKASTNSFFNSLATGLSQSGLTKNELNDYVPAILFTLYDGYYIYTPYSNIAEARNNGEGVTFDDNSSSKSNMKFDFKPFTYYTCEYKNNNFDIIVNYTLDNYISVMGTYGGKYFTASGYYINPNGISINDSNKVVTINRNSKSITLSPESLGEFINFVDEQQGNDEKTQTIINNNEPQYYRYINYNEEKYYFDMNPNTNAISYQGIGIFYLQSNKRIYIGKDMGNTLAKYILGDSNDKNDKHTFEELNIDNFKDVNYYYYYRDAQDFSQGIYDKLKDININTDVVTDSFKKQYNVYFSNNDKMESGSHVKSKFNDNQAHIFDYDKTDNDPELESSYFNAHRIDVIIASIEDNLTTSITNFNRYFSSQYYYAMPTLSEDDWNKIANGITTVTFMQGLTVGNYKFYNNYAVVSNTKNKEFISRNSIFVQDYETNPKYQSNDSQYHAIGCIKYNQDKPSNVVGYRNIDYQIQSFDITVNDNKTNTYYYYMQPDSQAYECVVSRNQSYFTSDDYFSFEDKKVTVKNSNGNEEEVEISDKIRRAYIQALAREKAASSKNLSNLNIQTVVN